MLTYAIIIIDDKIQFIKCWAVSTVIITVSGSS